MQNLASLFPLSLSKKKKIDESTKKKMKLQNKNYKLVTSLLEGKWKMQTKEAKNEVKATK